MLSALLSLLNNFYRYVNDRRYYFARAVAGRRDRFSRDHRFYSYSFGGGGGDVSRARDPRGESVEVVAVPNRKQQE